MIKLKVVAQMDTIFVVNQKSMQGDIILQEQWAGLD